MISTFFGFSVIPFKTSLSLISFNFIAQLISSIMIKSNLSALITFKIVLKAFLAVKTSFLSGFSL